MTASPRGTIGQTSAPKTGQVIEQIDQETGADQRLDSAAAAGAAAHPGRAKAQVSPSSRRAGRAPSQHLAGAEDALGSSVRLSVFISSQATGSLIFGR